MPERHEATEKTMGSRVRRFRQTISFRLSDEDYLRIEQEVKETLSTPHDWCREAALERLNRGLGLSKSQRILFDQVVRSQYLIGLGLQLLADNKLTSDEWKKVRTYARQNLEPIGCKALEDLLSRKAS
jgi:hypothetical protein